MRNAALAASQKLQSWLDTTCIRGNGTDAHHEVGGAPLADQLIVAHR